MADKNNQRAMEFSTQFRTVNLDAVALNSQGQTALLNDIKAIVNAGIRDLYGDAKQTKYIYIVDLIIKRIVEVLEDAGYNNDLTSIKKNVDEVLKKLNEEDADEDDEEGILKDKDVEKVTEELDKKIVERIKEHQEKIKTEFDEFREELLDAVSEDKSSDKKADEKTDKKKEETKTEDTSKSQKTAEQPKTETPVAETTKAAEEKPAAVEKPAAAVEEKAEEPQAEAPAVAEEPPAAVEEKTEEPPAEESAASSDITAMLQQLADQVNFIQTKLENIATGMQKNFDALHAKSSANISGFNVIQHVVNQIAKSTTDSIVMQKKQFDMSISSYKKTFTTIKKSVTSVKQLGTNIKGFGKSIVKSVKKSFNSAIKSVGNFLSGSITSIFSVIMMPFIVIGKLIFGLVSKIFGFIFNFLMSPAGLIAALGIGLILWNLFEPQILALYDEYIKPVVDFIGEVINFVADTLATVFGVGDERPFSERISSMLQSWWQSIQKTVIPFIKKNWKKILSALGLAIFISNPLKTILTMMQLMNASIALIKFGITVVKFIQGLECIKTTSILSSVLPIAIAVVAILAIVGAIIAIVSWIKHNAEEAQAAAQAKIDSINDTVIATAEGVDSMNEKTDRFIEENAELYDKLAEKAGIVKKEKVKFAKNEAGREIEMTDKYLKSAFAETTIQSKLDKQERARVQNAKNRLTDQNIGKNSATYQKAIKDAITKQQTLIEYAARHLEGYARKYASEDPSKLRTAEAARTELAQLQAKYVTQYAELSDDTARQISAGGDFFRLSQSSAQKANEYHKSFIEELAEIMSKAETVVGSDTVSIASKESFVKSLTTTDDVMNAAIQKLNHVSGEEYEQTHDTVIRGAATTSIENAFNGSAVAKEELDAAKAAEGAIGAMFHRVSGISDVEVNSDPQLKLLRERMRDAASAVAKNAKMQGKTLSSDEYQQMIAEELEKERQQVLKDAATYDKDDAQRLRYEQLAADIKAIAENTKAAKKSADAAAANSGAAAVTSAAAAAQATQQPNVAQKEQ